MSAVPPAGAHGGDGAAVAAALGMAPADLLDLSASFNPVAPDPAPVVARHLGALGRYPDPGPAARALAAAMGVAPERVLLTNGGAEAIALVAAEVGGHVVGPEFGLYERHLAAPAAGGGPRWRSNPHNPSGRLAPPTERAGVWDEAFYGLATGHWSRGDADDGAVVVGSLTKLWACPGLRVGYVVADPALVERLGRRQPRWSLNGLAAAALPDLLDATDLAGWARAVADLRAALVAVLEEHGLGPGASDANYVLCRRAPGLRERLAPHGVVVRDCAGFGLPGSARVSVPDEAGLARLGAALRAAGVGR